MTSSPRVICSTTFPVSSTAARSSGSGRPTNAVLPASSWIAPPEPSHASIHDSASLSTIVPSGVPSGAPSATLASVTTGPAFAPAKDSMGCSTVGSPGCADIPVISLRNSASRRSNSAIAVSIRSSSFRYAEHRSWTLSVNSSASFRLYPRCPRPSIRHATVPPTRNETTE
jgi:hypothetical protein